MSPIFIRPAPPDLDARFNGERPDYDFWDPRSELAVNVALAANRPLLVRGPAGCGKSTLAGAVADAMGWNLIKATISARTEPQDLLWELDAVARLGDAQASERHPPNRYVRPGPLWWAFNATSAALQRKTLVPSCQTGVQVSEGKEDRRCVLLIDEIDKADPDLPNALLEALDGFGFHVPATGESVTGMGEPPLVIITTNEYRELSRPFLRRCVELRLKLPDAAQLVEIARYHFGADTHGIYEPLARRCVALRTTEDGDSDQRPGTAEYLDAVRACSNLGIREGTDHWEWLLQLSMAKGSQK